jgi:radical SAM superfamily enzyme YgiQ (UPF0313 family)
LTAFTEIATILNLVRSYRVWGSDAVAPSIYLINPVERSPGYHSLEVLEAWRIAKAVNFADLSTTTIAALVPRDWSVAICDERVENIDFETKADIIGISGKVSQRDRMIELAREFHRRGKLVVFGGPYVTLNPEDLRPHADIIVRGEVEEIAERLFTDISRGRWVSDYEGTQPDMSKSPVPRWDLYPRRAALTGQIQTSRGCPFECEFCDVIQYLGRKQRWKEPDQVIGELDTLYQLGYRGVFFADDNFTVMRRRTHALLERIIEWNRARPAGRMRFSTQASIDLARDEALLAQCAEAGLGIIFVGIETPSQDSLAETRKRQNMRVDLAAEVHKIVNAGIMVTCGIVVGFDHDDSSIFERQAAFIETLPVPAISLSVLVAPFATPLYVRLQQEGRIASHGRVGAGEFMQTNFYPKLMSRKELTNGAQRLLSEIYTPEAYGRRLVAFVDASPVRRGVTAEIGFSRLEMLLSERLRRYGSGDHELVKLIGSLSLKRPDLRAQLRFLLLFYCQVRFMLEYHRLSRPPRMMAHRPIRASLSG